MGRPSKYEREIKPHLEDIRKAVEAGATVEEIAKAFGIAVSTLHRYKAEKKELQDAFARGRENVIIDIKAALLKKALGFSYEEKKQYITESDGVKKKHTEITTRYSPPSETAAAMLLRNYSSEWRDTDSASSELRKQEHELRKAIAASNNFDLDI